MYDDLYPEAAQTALEAKVSRPLEPKQSPRFSLWGTTAAVPKGVAAGAAQATGSAADILGAFGSVLGTEGSAGGMFSLPTPEEDKQQREATEKLRANGPDYMSEGGRSFRNVAKDYTPDPLTTHAAERIVFDFSRVASKAVTAAITMGGVPGAIVTGLEEGFTVSDQLAQEGVDLGTRSAVGAVTAATNALSFGLPVAGKTAVQTGVLALTGGPLSFMAQNAATRKILQDADYSKLADQYDPFDPLGLALSTGLTVIPLGFGAMAMRGAAKRAAGQKIRESDATETVASDGAPDVREITVYHGTETSFDNFESGMFTSNRSRAENYAMGGAKRVIEARLDIQNPMPWADAFGKTPEEIKAAGFDGTVQWGANGEVVRAVVVDPAQVKKVSSPETVDAARTSLLRESVDNSNPLPKDLAAAQPHADAHAKAIDQMASGERVSVADVLPENVAMKATEDMAARVEPIRKELAKANLMDFMGESKVVTPEGEPLVVYHGTRSSFDQFGNDKLGTATGADSTKLGHFFTDTVSGDPRGYMASGADVYAADRQGSYEGGGNIVPAYLNLTNPKTLTSADMVRAHIDKDALKMRQEAVAAGHDGFVYRDGKENWYIAFDPKQIKSALGNSGLFDPRSGSLTDPLPAKPIAGAKESAPKQAGAPDYAQNIDLIEAQRIRAVADKMRAKNPGVAAKYDDMALAHELKAERDTRMAEGQGEKASYHEKEATRLALENPDVMVMVEGMDAPKPLSEVMAMIKKDLADDIEDSNLIQVAAECFISTGAGGT